MDDILDKLRAHTLIDENTGCWLWQGAKDGPGYGMISNNYPKIHRLSAYFHLGYDLNDKQNHVLHKPHCLNRHCWNPDHLYIGTNQENVQDAVKRGTHNTNSWKTHCKNGHSLDGVNSRGYRFCIICRNEAYKMKKQGE
jgi:hypothetical protein